MWKNQIHIAYANLVGLYSELIDKRLSFHKRYKHEMPNGNLDFNDKMEISDEVDYLFEVSADVCDQLEMNLRDGDGFEGSESEFLGGFR